MSLIILLGGIFLLFAIYTEYLKQSSNQKKATNITHIITLFGFLVVAGLFLTLLSNIKNLFF